jgi:hypothetical protein
MELLFQNENRVGSPAHLWQGRSVFSCPFISCPPPSFPLFPSVKISLRKWHDLARKWVRVTVGRLSFNSFQRQKRHDRTVFRASTFSILWSHGSRPIGVQVSPGESKRVQVGKGKTNKLFLFPCTNAHSDRFISQWNSSSGHSAPAADGCSYICWFCSVSLDGSSFLGRGIPRFIWRQRIIQSHPQPRSPKPKKSRESYDPDGPEGSQFTETVEAKTSHSTPSGW